jgi:Terminase large subunit, T4likevirus-type, N-terminal/Terminase RNAseH like domain
MEFHQTQNQVASNKAKFRVVCAGRQWGKTSLSVWEMLTKAYSKSGTRVGYFAPTYVQARDIAWRQLCEATKPLWSKPPNEQRLELEIKTVDKGTSEIVLKSWQAVESVRGTQFDFVVLDEVSKMRNFEEGWEAVMLGTLLYRNGDALFISTPYGDNHFKKLFNKTGNEWSSFKFTSYDNPTLKKDLIDTIKDNSTPDFFSQEYLANFVRFTGLIYKEFDITNHVHDFDPLPTTNNKNGATSGYTLFGLDFAVRGFTACLLAQVDRKGEIYILDEYKVSSETAENHIKAITTLFSKYGLPVSNLTGYADPAGFAKNQQGKDGMIWSLADEYQGAGFSIVRANNEVTAGINYVRQLFQQNKIHIHPRCEKLIEELQQYQWKDKPDTQVGRSEDPEQVRKLNDHLVDAMRYLCYSKPSLEEEEETLKIEFPKVLELKITPPDPDLDGITPIEFESIY